MYIMPSHDYDMSLKYVEKCLVFAAVVTAWAPISAAVVHSQPSSTSEWLP